MISDNIFHTNLFGWRGGRISNYTLVEYYFRGHKSLIEKKCTLYTDKIPQNSKILYTLKPPSIIREIIILSDVAKSAENFNFRPFHD